MNNVKYTGGCEPPSEIKEFSEIELQIDNISKDIEVLYYQMTEMGERLKSILSPENPQDSSGAKALRCSISPLGGKIRKYSF
ncbi:MAG: hypothetical protein HQK53_18675 [Oligoflexia bacterium]|nr:hypothetical protein [Oligoflexia bacterium]